eukprot:COSAG04_NODE_2630_length_3833_cov_1.806642_5_plen_124_part_00
MIIMIIIMIIISTLFTYRRHQQQHPEAHGDPALGLQIARALAKVRQLHAGLLTNPPTFQRIRPFREPNLREFWPMNSDLVPRDFDRIVAVPNRRDEGEPALLVVVVLFTNMSDYVGLNRIKSD